MSAQFTLHHGDCLDVLKTLADNSVDSIVTDPPYGLTQNKKGGSGTASVDPDTPYGRARIGTGNGAGGFMGLKWDSDVPSTEVWAECLRVLKPGGHLLAFAGTRTQHRMATRIEDAGFEVRDMLAFIYGTGFPKSLDVSKAIDKAAGEEREVIGIHRRHGGGNAVSGSLSGPLGRDAELPLTAPATEAARQWQGWGTALKPALEPITMARKPFASTVAENVLEHGTGALHIDACRIDAHDGVPQFFPGEGRGANATGYDMGASNRTGEYSYAGRWPANLIHDGSEDVIALFHAQSGALPADSGSAARFFYCAKASKDDRDEGLRGFEAKNNMRVNGPRENEEAKRQTLRANHHPTVKPVDLMAYLCRLVTPKGGIVLDPFMGSGSTGKAAVRENFRFIGIEREADYIAIAHARIAFELRKGFQHSLLEGAP